MKQFSNKLTAGKIASLLKVQLEGNPDSIINNASELTEANSQSMCFLGNAKFFSAARECKAGLLFVDPDVDKTNLPATNMIIVPQP